MRDCDVDSIRSVAESLLAKHYGIHGTAYRLAGEKDLNFLMTTSARLRYVLKISHPDERLDVVRLQREALGHIARVDPGLNIPSVVLMTDGAGEICEQIGDGPARIVRLLSYLEGTMLHETVASPAQDRALGGFLARVGLALRECTEVPARSAHLWDLQHLPSSRHLTMHLSDPRTRSRVERSYDEFERHATPVLPSLRAQPIHNDMNPYNVVVDPSDACVVAGIIDFGDMARGPLACDAAIGAAYRWSLNEHPLAGAVRFLQGYTAVRAFQTSELDVMFDLIRGRLAMIINVGNWQALSEPDNEHYALRLHNEVLQALEHLSAVTREDGRRMLRSAVETRHHG